jgi:dUTP pyrophosphatase
MTQLLVKRLHPDAILPVKGTPDSAGWDLSVLSVENDGIGWTVHTGLAFAMEPGHVMMLFPRSGLGTKLGLGLRNTVGIIDSDYRGEVMIKLTRGLPDVQEYVLDALKPGSRIAQAIILEVPMVDLVVADELPATIRGTGGFGSTG